MQFAVITGPTFETAKKRIKLANQFKDGIELRLDLFKESLDLDHLKDLFLAAKKKVILTLRKKNQGGGYVGTEENRQIQILELLKCAPDYVDIEFDSSPSFLREVKLLFPSCKIISSFHNLATTPKDLELIFQQMPTEDVYAYKICTTANSLADSYKMLRFIQKKKTDGVNIIGLCMGEHGQITRKEGLKAGNYLNYSILHNYDNCSPGLHLA